MPAAYQRRQSSDPQSSLSLDRKVITQVSPESSNSGKITSRQLLFGSVIHDTPSGFATSLESSNNFINFCATSNLPLTDGKQIKTGSCNPAPMGSIPSIDNIPSVKFQFPTNGVILKEGTTITVTVAMRNIRTGSFVNSEQNYLGAPQQLSPEGAVLGHGSIVIEKINSFDQTAPLDPNIFSFCVSSPQPDINGVWTVNVDKGLPEGFYRISTIILTANHQPIAVSVLQRGAIDDVAYFTVTSDGQPPVRTPLNDFRPPYTGGSESINTTDPNADPSNQNSTTLLSSVIAKGFAKNGQETSQTPTQEPSLTSVNNFINYCLEGLATRPITNGKQSNRSSCSPTPIGMVPPITVMPSHKFQAPKNGDTIPANTPFLVRLNYRNMNQAIADQDSRYLSAPQQIDSTGAILGYSRIVIEELTAINQTSVTDPRNIAVSAALAQVDENGAMMTNITKGLPDGFYRLSSIALTANHYPVTMPILQHGAVNDAIYFTVGNGGDGSTTANTIPAGPGETGRVNPNPEPQRSGSSNVGAAVGGALGGLALIALIIALLFFHRRRKRRMAKVFIPPGYPVLPGNYPVQIEQPNTPPPLQPGEIRPYYIGPGEGPSLAGKRSEKQSHSTLESSNTTPGSSSGEPQTQVNAGPSSTNLHRMETVMSLAPSYHTLEDRRR
ncbi:hypothetical protein VNI00_005420 [Paramarasmius palmivorus]|uniref:Uncharacterized protein n=1 Tax=Paramarasmius palmivorus TaxID=297713 RepID=A0AAW0DDU3_9AGAR